MARADGLITTRPLLPNRALVCMAMAGLSVVDKAVAIVLPVSAFVATGFEPSIANMWPFPLAMLVQRSDPSVGASAVTWVGMIGNLLGDSVLMGLTYHLIYRRERPG